MNTRFKTLRWLLLTVGTMALALLGGCRAFEPEAVLVNNPPETYLTGAPLQGGGGYYHYHMFWYGSDEDGVVEKFVWALTDTSVQIEDTSDDEEDARFNPALDITHLDVGHWTTRTDSIFDFEINQGTAPSIDMTFHLVAVDDRGDFDRTPARLHFFSNTLGTPVIEFFRVEGESLVPPPIQYGPDAAPDTVGYGEPYTVAWQGSTPNILGYDLDALRLIDEVAPFDDGLKGYKWQLSGDLGGNCVPTIVDCWHPRLFNEATGDSFSYFADITRLTFENSVANDPNPFRTLLPSGLVNLKVNSIDVAGVEVADFRREFNLMVNFDPETILLNGEADWAHPEDPQVYPYYTLLNDPSHAKHPFEKGDRIPDRSYVVFKALARDDPRDHCVRCDPEEFQIGFTGQLSGVLENYTGGFFNFQGDASEINYAPAWPAGEGGWYADTLGFLVGPRTEFSFRMQSVDEHGRRDGTPPSFNFFVGYEPCVQCVEIVPEDDPSSFGPDDLDCYDPRESVGHPCFGDTVKFSIKEPFTPALPGVVYLDDVTNIPTGYLNITKTSTLTPSFSLADPEDPSLYTLPVTTTSFKIYLHGMDHPDEAYLEEIWRSLGWRYQIDYNCDPGNLIQDAGGNDDLDVATYGYTHDEQDHIGIDPETGLWWLKVDILVPLQMLSGGGGATVFEDFIVLYLLAQGDEELRDRLLQVIYRQFSIGSVSAIMIDQTDNGFMLQGPSRYHLFRNVRPPEYTLQDIGSPTRPRETWRDFEPTYANMTSGTLRLRNGAMDSSVYNEAGELVPPVKYFQIQFQDMSGRIITCDSE